MRNKVAPLNLINKIQVGLEEATEEFEKIEGSFTSQEQYWACRAGFIEGYEAAKNKYQTKQQEQCKCGQPKVGGYSCQRTDCNQNL